MNRLTACFTKLKTQGRKALIPYLSAGDPDSEQTVAVLHALVAGGANLLELGVAFSDPAADGETIRCAHERALARGMTLQKTLAIVRDFRADDDNTPLILMGYLNSFERAGFGKIMAEMKQAGVDGVILVDCPVEALPDYEQDLTAARMPVIMLITPTTTPKRRQEIIARAAGFIYFVSLRGVTGTQIADAAAITDAVAAVKADTDLPVCIGFGIRNGQTAKQMAAMADGVIIGSALVAKLHRAALQGENLAATAQAFISEIRQHLDAKELP